MRLLRLRFSILCLTILCIVCLPISKPVFYTNGLENVTYYYYTYNVNKEIESAKIINNGDFSIVVCDAKNSSKTKKQLDVILGESIRILNYNNFTLRTIINKYQKSLVKKEKIDDYEFMLCYDNTLPQYVLIDDIKVNLQIAISNDQINIGYPLILNGF